jgi:hypothetical protein
MAMMTGLIATLADIDLEDLDGRSTEVELQTADRSCERRNRGFQYGIHRAFSAGEIIEDKDPGLQGMQQISAPSRRCGPSAENIV